MHRSHPRQEQPMGDHHHADSKRRLDGPAALAHPDLRHHLAGLRRLLLHPQGLLRSQARHRRRPRLRPRQGGHGRPGRPLPRRLRRGPVRLGQLRRPLRPARGGGRRAVRLGPGGAGHGHLRHRADLRHLHGRPGPGAVHRLVGAVQEHGRLLLHRRARPRHGLLEHLLRLRRPGGHALRRLVRLPAQRRLAGGLHRLRRRGAGRGLPVPAAATQPPGRRRPAASGRRTGNAGASHHRPVGRVAPGAAQPHRAGPGVGLLSAQAGALRHPVLGPGDHLRTHAGNRQGRRRRRPHCLRGRRPARAHPHRPGLGPAVRRPAHARLRAQPAGAGGVPGAVHPGAAQRQPVPGGGAAVPDGRHPLRSRLDDQRRRRHRLRHPPGRRHRHRLRQRLRFGGGDPRRPAARLLRHLLGVHPLHLRRADRLPAAGAVLAQPPAGGRAGAAPATALQAR